MRKEDLELYYQAGTARIKPKGDENFGLIKSPDGTQQFEAYEIVFHVPGEHTFKRRKRDMEVQVLHRTMVGDFK